LFVVYTYNIYHFSQQTCTYIVLEGQAWKGNKDSTSGFTTGMAPHACLGWCDGTDLPASDRTFSCCLCYAVAPSQATSFFWHVWAPPLPGLHVCCSSACSASLLAPPCLPQCPSRPGIFLLSAITRLPGLPLFSRCPCACRCLPHIPSLLPCSTPSLMPTLLLFLLHYRLHITRAWHHNMPP